ncbi:hypothetical protein KBD59_04865 [Candidatus Gracilibacteria bacterium]|nr:hypothetical protein [Candidatus Gracilibacteria bacterium]
MKRFGAVVMTLMLVLSACSFSKKDPAVAVQEGFVKMLENHEASTAATVSGTVAGPAGEVPSKMNFSMNLTGSSDSTDLAKTKFDQTIKIEVAADDLKGGGTLYLRSDGTDIFAKISDLSVPGEKGVAAVAQLEPLMNKWWKIPADVSSQLKQTEEEQKKLTEKLKTLTPFTNVVEDGEEDVHGDSSTRYRVDINKDAIKEFILEAARVGGNVMDTETVSAIEDGLKDVQFSGAVSVNNDGYMNRIKGTITIQPTDGTSGSFDFDMTSWNIGDKVEISAPEGAADFNPLMMFSILGALGSTGGLDGTPATTTDDKELTPDTPTIPLTPVTTPVTK